MHNSQFWPKIDVFLRSAQQIAHDVVITCPARNIAKKRARCRDY